MDNLLEPTDAQLWQREVTCYCKERQVVSRRDPSKDQYVICSRQCWDRMLRDGMHEPGSLYKEWVGSNVTSFYTTT